MTDLGRQSAPRLSQRIRPWQIVLIVVGGFAACGLLLYFILSTTLGPLVESGDRFMTALRDGNFQQAHALATPALQRELGDPQRMGSNIGTYRPAEWSWSGRQVRNGSGGLEGTVTYRGGVGGRARLELHQVDGELRVAAYRLN